MLTKPKIVDALVRAGITPGEALIVHNSYKALGEVDGGPSAVVEAMKETVTEAGTLAMPAFTYRHKSYDVDLAETPSTMGVITEVFRRSEGVVRSGHFTHSVCVWGRDKGRFAAAHTNVGAGPFAKGTPFDLLGRMNAWVLSLGVTGGTNSYLHAVEELLERPFLKRVVQTDDDGNELVARVTHPDGLGVDWPVTMSIGGWDGKGYTKVDDELERRGQLIRFEIGEASCYLRRTNDLYAAAADMVQRDPYALFCDLDDCVPCDRARAVLAEQGGL